MANITNTEDVTRSVMDLGYSGGEAPGAYVERIRTGTAETMRRNFVRRPGISPDQYRKTFA